MSTTTDYPVETTTELFADFIAAPASSMSPAAIAEHMQQNQITFEIPSAHDLRHIDALHSFNALLQRIGKASYDSDALDVATISTEQLSKSVVLDLADLREHNADLSDVDSASAWTQIFGEADTHAVINYLWIGVVSSLVVLSLVFIVFSCYFYRKFRTWKKCNKDIRAQIHGSDSSYSSHGHGHASHSAAHLLQPALGSGEGACYQIESPPCYTIATGLPSYDEALHHQPRHFAYGMKFMYPSLAAVHHHHHHACLSSWEKEELRRQNKPRKCQLSTPATAEEAKAPITPPTAICISLPSEEEQRLELELEQPVATRQSQSQSLLPAAANDDDCSSLVVVVDCA